MVSRAFLRRSYVWLWMLVLLESCKVIIVIELAAAVKTTSHGITEDSASLLSPGYPNCDGTYSSETRWILAPVSELAIIKFEDFDIPRCSAANLTITYLLGEGYVYCEEQKPPSIISGKKVTIIFHSYGSDCGRGVNISYVSPALTVDLKKTIKAKENISVAISIPNLPSGVIGKCDRKINDDLERLEIEKLMGKKSFELATGRHEVIEEFAISGIFEYQVSCTLLNKKNEEEIAFVQTVLSAKIHDDLQRLSSIEINEGKTCVPTELPVIFKHEFVYPITYHLFPDDDSYQHVTHTRNSIKDLLDRSQSLKTSIKLPWLKRLAAGRHRINLLLENAVSVKNLAFSLDRCERLTAINILPIEYIGISPSNFTVTVEIEKGSPATVQVVFKNNDSGETTSATTFCGNPQECSRASVQMSVKSEGVFNITATANNSLGNVVTKYMGSVKSFPLVQKVFVTASSSPINTVSPGKFFVLYKIPSNRGTYELQLSVDGQAHSTKKISSHVLFKDAAKSLSDLRIPFNPISYKVYNYSHKFTTPGKPKIGVEITTENGEQSMMAETQITVLSKLTTTCLRGVRIQDGRNGSVFVETFSGTAILIFAAVVDANCAFSEDRGLEYKWKMYKTESLDEPPDFATEIPIPGVRTDTAELNIDPRRIDPGLYVFEIAVTYVDPVTHDKLQVVDFVSMKTPKFSMDVQICGGLLRKIGLHVSELEFDASCSVNPELQGVKFTWFCALMEEDLPSNKRLGMIQTKGSCVEGKPLISGKSRKININVTSIRAEGTFFVRVFLSFPGYDDVFADQEIVIMSRSAPTVKLECWSNCEREVRHVYPLLLHATCKSCDSLTWYLDGASKGKGNFFHVTSEELKGFRDWIEVKVVGSDGHSKNPYVVYRRKIAHPPSFTATVWPQEFDPENPHRTLTCKSDEKLLIKISMSPNKGKTFTLVKYGYDRTISDDCAAPHHNHPFLTVKIEACNLDGICTYWSHSMVIKNRISVGEETTVYQNKLLNAVKVGNKQEVVKQALQLSAISGLWNKTKSVILEFALKSPITSLESAKQSLDLLFYGSTIDLPQNDQRRVVDRLSDINSTFNNNANMSSSFFCEMFVGVMIDLAGILVQAMKTTKVDSNPSFHTMTNILAALSRDSLRDGSKDSKLSYENAVILLTMKRFPRDSVMVIKNSTISVKASASKDKDVKFSDLMIFRFLSRNTNFETKTGSPDEVTGVSFVESRKVLGEARPRTKSFIPSGTVHFALKTERKESRLKYAKIDLHSVNTKLNTTSLSSNLGEQNSLRNEPIPVFQVGKRLIAVQGDYDAIALKIRILLPNMTAKQIQSIEMELVETNNQTESNFSGTNVIVPNGVKTTYDWELPFFLEGNNILDLNMKIKSTSGVDHIFVLPYGIKCSYWSDDLNDWTSKGCKAAMKSGWNSWGYCSCDLHKQISSSVTSRSAMQLLSTQLVVFPNEIDLSKLFGNETGESENNIMSIMIENIKSNPTMMITVVSSYVIFSAALILAKLEDDKDQKSPSYIEVCDNKPNERYRYLVTVFTGSRPCAGSSSTVRTKLLGRHGSVAHVLQENGKERILLRDSVITFLMTTPSCLGDIRAVRIQHGNEGKNPNWYLGRLVVRDYQTNDCWFFLVNTWISYHKGKPRSGTTVKVATSKELHSFWNLFMVKVHNLLNDWHVWYSLLAMRTWSVYNMTRAQRVACCMLIVYMTMATLLMFHEEGPPPTAHLVAYPFRWSDVLAGLASAALCFPLTLLVGALFRYSREHEPAAQSHGRNKNSSQARRAVISSKIKSVKEQPHSSNRKTLSGEKRKENVPSHRGKGGPRSSTKVPREKESSHRRKYETDPARREVSGRREKESSHRERREPVPPKMKVSRRERRENEASHRERSFSEGKHLRDPLNKKVLSGKSSSAKKPHRRQHQPHSSSRKVWKEGSTKELKPSLGAKQTLSQDAEMLFQSSRYTVTPSHRPSISEISSEMPCCSREVTHHYPHDSLSSGNGKYLQYDETMVKSSLKYKPTTQKLQRQKSGRKSTHCGRKPSRPSARRINAFEEPNELQLPKRRITQSRPCQEKISPSHKKFDDTGNSDISGETAIREIREVSRRRKKENPGPEHNIFFPQPSAGSARNHPTGSRQDQFKRRSDRTRRNKGVTIVEMDPSSINFKPVPWFGSYLAWAIIIVVVLTSGALSVLYGMIYGPHVSKQCVLSLAIGIIESIFIMEPLKAIVFGFISVYNNTRHDVSDWIPPVRTKVLPRKRNTSSGARKSKRERETNSSHRPSSVKKDKKKDSRK